MVADGQSVTEIRVRLKEHLKMTPEEAEQVHAKSGLNIFVNRVAWALSHLVQGKAIVLRSEGIYQITEGGKFILKGDPSELTIGELH